MSWLSLLPEGAVRGLRGLILKIGRGIDSQKMMDQSQRKASRMIHFAAKHSAAYRTLLREHGIDDKDLREPWVWKNLPVLTKQNTFGRFALSELARDVPAKDLADVLTSSGRGGRSFGFRLTERARHEEGWFDIDLGLQDVFDVDRADHLAGELPTDGGLCFDPGRWRWPMSVCVRTWPVPSCEMWAQGFSRRCCARTRCSSVPYSTKRRSPAWIGVR